MKLFIGNLSWDATEEELKSFFENHSGEGSVRSARIVQDPYTGRSKGFGFVEMKDEASAQSVIDGLNDAAFKGRPLRVSRAREQERGERRSGGGNGGGYGGGGYGGGGGGGYGGQGRGDRGDRGERRAPRGGQRRFED